MGAVTMLRRGGCDETVVVLGAAADQARRLLETSHDAPCTVVEPPDWADGMGRSLAAGRHAAADTGATAAAVHLVDLPDVGPAVLRRVVSAAGMGPDVLARASYAGRPGHPVLIGRRHLRPLATELAGDRGGMDYLRQGVQLVDCADLASGIDLDHQQPRRCSIHATPGPPN